MSVTLDTGTPADNPRRVDIPSGKARKSLFALLRYSRDIDRRLEEEIRLMNKVLEDTRALNRR